MNTPNPGYDAWDLVSQAVDHLGTLRLLLRSVLPTHAPFTLLRAAMENAALAYWIAGPDDSDVRVARCLRLAHDDAKQAGDLLEYMPPESWTGMTPKEKMGRTISIHKANGLPGSPAQRFGFRSIMKVVGEESGINRMVEADRMHPSSRVRDPLVVYWSQCSGMTHGYSWARFGMLKSKSLPGADNDPDAASQAWLNGSIEDVMSLLEVSVILNDLAWKAHKRRRSANPLPAEDLNTEVGRLPDPSVVSYEATTLSDPGAFWRRPPGTAGSRGR